MHESGQPLLPKHLGMRHELDGPASPALGWTMPINPKEGGTELFLGSARQEGWHTAPTLGLGILGPAGGHLAHAAWTRKVPALRVPEY